MSSYEVTIIATVKVEVSDESVITRVTENEDNWRGTHYAMADIEEVMQHLLYNRLANGITQVDRLDGWADCSPDAVAYDFLDVDVDEVRAAAS